MGVLAALRTILPLALCAGINLYLTVRAGSARLRGEVSRHTPRAG